MNLTNQPQKYSKKYKELKQIGRGTQGAATLIENREDGRKYVSKKVGLSTLSEKDQKAAVEELRFLSEMKHPNIVKFIEGYKERSKVITVMEYCEWGDLSNFIQQKQEKNEYLEEEFILQWFVQLTQALLFIHSKKIIHRDIKASNIFITKNNCLKIGDFGISKQLSNTLDNAFTLIGTPNYMSPEVCQSKPYSSKSDMWSLGCILFELCSLKVVQDAPPKIPTKYSSTLDGFVRALLRKNPDQRPSAVDILSSPTIQKLMQEFVLSKQQTLNERNQNKDEIAAEQRDKEFKQTKKPGPITLLEMQMQERLKQEQENMKKKMSSLFQESEIDTFKASEAFSCRSTQSQMSNNITQKERECQEIIEKMKSEVMQSYKRVGTPQTSGNYHSTGNSHYQSLAISQYQETGQIHEMISSNQDEESNLEKEGDEPNANSELVTSSEGEREISGGEEDDECQSKKEKKNNDDDLENTNKLGHTNLEVDEADATEEHQQFKSDTKERDKELSCEFFSPSMVLENIQQSILLTNQDLAISQFNNGSHDKKKQRYDEEGIEEIALEAKSDNLRKSKNTSLINNFNDTNISMNLSITNKSAFLQSTIAQALKQTNSQDRVQKSINKSQREGRSKSKDSVHNSNSKQNQNEIQLSKTSTKGELEKSRGRSREQSRGRIQKNLSRGQSSENIEEDIQSGDYRGRSRDSSRGRSIGSQRGRSKGRINSSKKIGARNKSKDEEGYEDDFESYKDDGSEGVDEDDIDADIEKKGVKNNQEKKDQDENYFEEGFEEYVESDDKSTNEFDCYFVFDDDDEINDEFNELDSILDIYKTQLMKSLQSKNNRKITESINRFNLSEIIEESVEQSSLIQNLH